jgi:hypothetical protein
MSSYRAIAVKELTSYIEERKDMSLGEIMYSFMRKGILSQNTKEGKLKFLRDSTDEQIYTAIEKAKKDERGE